MHDITAKDKTLWCLGIIFEQARMLVSLAVLLLTQQQIDWHRFEYNWILRIQSFEREWITCASLILSLGSSWPAPWKKQVLRAFPYFLKALGDNALYCDSLFFVLSNRKLERLWASTTRERITSVTSIAVKTVYRLHLINLLFYVFSVDFVVLVTAKSMRFNAC